MGMAHVEMVKLLHMIESFFDNGSAGWNEGLIDRFSTWRSGISTLFVILLDMMSKKYTPPALVKDVADTYLGKLESRLETYLQIRENNLDDALDMSSMYSHKRTLEDKLTKRFVFFYNQHIEEYQQKFAAAKPAYLQYLRQDVEPLFETIRYAKQVAENAAASEC